jgi:DMSO/TMAO reductase YedYZ molybdopterin-dependent catalytic subunit
MARATRGFTGRRRSQQTARLAPGQDDVGRDWPVLTAEVTPRLDPASWTMTVDGLVERPSTWTWDEAHALPQSAYAGDIHCVTTWSSSTPARRGGRRRAPRGRATRTRCDVRARHLDDRLHHQPAAGGRHGRQGMGGADVRRTAGATRARPPARLLVPHLYFRKSAKWVTRLTVLDHDQQGFRERNGFHDRGDPCLEQRYQGD